MKLVHQIGCGVLGAMLLVVTAVAALMGVGVERGFSRYVRSLEEARLENPVRRLERYYERAQSWDELAASPWRFRQMLRREEDDGPDDDRPRGRRARGERGAPRGGAALDGGQERASPRADRSGDPSRVDPLELPPRVSLYDADHRRVIGDGSPDADASSIPIVVNGSIVGWLGVRPIDRFNQRLDLDYMRQVRLDLAIVTALAFLVSALASVLIARRIVRPLHELVRATRRLAQGDYDARLAFRSGDELGDLARDFEALAANLAASQGARRQWIAETSHELRTPLTILRAEVEAMLDGVRPIDEAGIASLDAELRRLSTIVADLAQLATADRAELRAARALVKVAPLLRKAVEGFAARFKRAGLALELDVADGCADRVLGDPERLIQVFTNLLENSARYTAPGGRARVAASNEGGALVITFDDAAPGVAPESLPKLFDPFFRAEPSRSREHGGSGLGLSICERWVKAFQGTIAASPSQLGGLRVEIRLPLAGGASEDE